VRIAVKALAGLAAVVALSSAALADMQCEGRFVGIGATTSEVLDLCGPPLRTVRSLGTVYTELEAYSGEGEVRVPIEEWTYEKPGEFARKLVFVGGKLEKVETGGYPDLE
jgi:hypothetical protein